MRGYDAWKTTPPDEGPEIYWEAEFLEDSPDPHHRCADCCKFLAHAPDSDGADVDGDSVRFFFTCACGTVNTVTSYPCSLAPDEPW